MEEINKIKELMHKIEVELEQSADWFEPVISWHKECLSLLNKIAEKYNGK